MCAIRTKKTYVYFHRIYALTNVYASSYLQKEMVLQADLYLVILSSKTCVFGDKLTGRWSV